MRKRRDYRHIFIIAMRDPFRLAESLEYGARHSPAHPVSFQCDQRNSHPQRIKRCRFAIERNRIKRDVQSIVQDHMRSPVRYRSGKFNTPDTDAVTAKFCSDAVLHGGILGQAIF